jgi:glutamyl-tRNA reductase
MSLILVGLSHKTAPIEARESIVIPEENLDSGLRGLLSVKEIKEAMILSTCNRTEVLAQGDHVHSCTEAIKALLASRGTVPPHVLEKYLYVLIDEDAVRHLFSVASSLDSMVVGEPQILGQVKEAYRAAVGCHACGPMLNRVLHQAFRVSKRIRNETAIGQRAVSISFAAVELARNIFEILERKTVLLVGAGEMVELAARHFLQRGVRRLLITNRTFRRAQELAGDMGGEPIPFEEFKSRLMEADIVLSCTGAPEQIIHVEDVKQALRLRKNRSIFLIDIAVPRDVDPRVNQLENAYLYDIDDLQGVVQRNREEREGEMQKAEEIVEGEVRRFSAWTESLGVSPTIKAIREMAEQVRSEELRRTLNHLEQLGDKERQALEAMTRAIINKLLHHPVTKLKQHGGPDGKGTYVQVARDLFGFDEEESEEP